MDGRATRADGRGRRARIRAARLRDPEAWERRYGRSSPGHGLRLLCHALRRAHHDAPVSLDGVADVDTSDGRLGDVLARTGVDGLFAHRSVLPSSTFAGIPRGRDGVVALDHPLAPYVRAACRDGADDADPVELFRLTTRTVASPGVRAWAERGVRRVPPGHLDALVETAPRRVEATLAAAASVPGNWLPGPSARGEWDAFTALASSCVPLVIGGGTYRDLLAPGASGWAAFLDGTPVLASDGPGLGDVEDVVEAFMSTFWSFLAPHVEGPCDHAAVTWRSVFGRASLSRVVETSRRWHDAPPMVEDMAAWRVWDVPPPVVLEIDGTRVVATFLASSSALREEGVSMRHCVGQGGYDGPCADGTTLVARLEGDGPGPRATVELATVANTWDTFLVELEGGPVGDDAAWRVVQTRSHRNGNDPFGGRVAAPLVAALGNWEPSRPAVPEVPPEEVVPVRPAGRVAAWAPFLPRRARTVEGFEAHVTDAATSVRSGPHRRDAGERRDRP